ncbi:hypothetical protein FOBRF1_007059 [Fusarium oxysporum]
MKYTEYQLQCAVDELLATGNPIKAAKEWQVPRTALLDRLNGRESRKTAHTHRQRLEPVQEAHLANWVLAQLALGLVPTHNQLREFAQRIVNRLACPDMISA